jgi:hypothetical protein
MATTPKIGTMIYEIHLAVQNFNRSIVASEVRLSRIKRLQSIVNRAVVVFGMDRTRKREFAYRRYTMYKWLHKENRIDLKSCGEIVCPYRPFDHASVHHGIEEAKKFLSTGDKLFKTIYDETMELINTLENE